MISLYEYGGNARYVLWQITVNWLRPIVHCKRGRLKGFTQVDVDVPPDVCMMYADAVPVTYCDVVEMKAELVSTLAMVTVKLEGLADLDAGIRVAPLKIRLKNVPDRCAVSPLVRNTAGSSSVGVVANGEEVNTALWGTLSTSNPVLGGHETGAVPLFLFENCQGDGTSIPK